MAVALIIIYNHKYEKNIEILEDIYKNKFSNIYHLMPFYSGDKANVIPVYESSYYFQGYIAQGLKFFYNETYEHYFFVADDMILNPIINENNYSYFFNIDNSTSFIQSLSSLPAGNWQHNRKAITYNPYSSGVEIKNEIPEADATQKIVENLRINNKKFIFRNTYFFNRDYSIRNCINQVINYLFDRKILATNLNKLKYPLILSYSDFFIVSSKSIKKFAHYSGVFAATNLWVELAIPTALALSAEKIATEDKALLKGKALWGEDVQKELHKYNFNLKKLINEFPKGYIFLHPIKLSMWK